MSLSVGDLVAYLGVDAGDFNKGLDKAKGVLDGWGGAIAATAAAAGVGVAVALTGALVEGMHMEQATDKLAAQLGMTGPIADDMGKLAGSIYADAFGASMDDVTAALKTTMQNGLIDQGATDEAVKHITESLMTVSTVLEEDVGATSEAVGQMMKTGMAKDAQEAFDILVRGAQNGANKSQDLLDTFNEYSTQFRKLGMDGQQALGLISQAIQAGARDSDTAADALKEFAIRAIDGSKATGEGFKALGLDARKMAGDIAAGGPAASAALDLTLDRLRGMKDPVDQAAAATALFGTKAEDLGAALFAMDPSSAVDGLGQLAGAADQAGATMGDNAATNIEKFKRQVTQTFVDVVGGKVLPAVDKIASTFATAFGPAVKDVTEWMGKHKAIVEPLGVVLGTFTGLILALVAGMKAWAIIQGILNVVMTANPVGLIVIAIAALVAGVIYAYTHFQGFRDAVGAVGDAFVWVWNWVKGNWPLLLAILTGPIGLAVLWITKHWDEIKLGATTVWQWIVDKFNALVSFVVGLPGRVGSAARGMFEGVVSTARGSINRLISMWNSLDFGINVHVPDWVPIIGGRRFSVPDIIPDLPMLAEGGLARGGRGGTLAMIAERQQDEIIAPLDKAQAMIDAAVRGALADAKGDGGRSGDLVVIVDGEVVKRIALDAVRDNPVEVALSSRAGGKRIGFAGA